MDNFYKNCPIWLKFGMQVSFTPLHHPVKFRWDRLIILPSSPTNLNADLEIFQIKQPVSPCCSVSWSVCYLLLFSGLPLSPLPTITCLYSLLPPTITAPAHTVWGKGILLGSALTVFTCLNLRGHSYCFISQSLAIPGQSMWLWGRVKFRLLHVKCGKFFLLLRFLATQL